MDPSGVTRREQLFIRAVKLIQRGEGVRGEELSGGDQEETRSRRGEGREGLSEGGGRLSKVTTRDYLLSKAGTTQEACERERDAQAGRGGSRQQARDEAQSSEGAAHSSSFARTLAASSRPLLNAAMGKSPLPLVHHSTRQPPPIAPLPGPLAPRPASALAAPVPKIRSPRPAPCPPRPGAAPASRLGALSERWRGSRGARETGGGCGPSWAQAQPPRRGRTAPPASRATGRWHRHANASRRLWWTRQGRRTRFRAQAGPAGQEQRPRSRRTRPRPPDSPRWSS